MNRKKTKQQAGTSTPTLQNRRARHDYEILEEFEAGLVLVGTEVKSIRAGKANISDAHCRIENGEVWVVNMHVQPYEQGNRYNVDPVRKRKLLLKRAQIERLRSQVETKGLTIIPLKCYFHRGYARLLIALARGKREWDRRETITKRDQEMQAARDLAERG